jgi:geranylgeranyl diphosphate synthase type II
VEFIHNYSLIHDDLPAMDNDDFRRGQPSLHRAFGEALALLAGDALLTLSFQVVAEAPFPAERETVKVDIIRWLSRAAGVEGMIGGQIQDLYFSVQAESEPAFLEMIKKKTGNLIIFSVMAGGILGGASEEEKQILYSFGEKLGYAFQLRDDLFDLGQDEQASSSREDSPNFTLTFGQERTRYLITRYLDDALGVLKEGGINSRELIYLAEMLRLEN